MGELSKAFSETGISESPVEERDMEIPMMMSGDDMRRRNHESLAVGGHLQGLSGYVITSSDDDVTLHYYPIASGSPASRWGRSTSLPPAHHEV